MPEHNGGVTAHTFSDLPGWHFTVEERSAGVYVALARDEAGRSVQCTGDDPDALLDRCREDARSLT
jgi:hypothetical protein